MTSERGPRRPRHAAKKIRRVEITIPLPSRPPDYKPGSGPPLPLPTLLPPADSTAYIDDRILLPPAGNAADGRPLPKRMKYIIGWRDLPAARLLVSAMDVLHYVSPHELEAWEFTMELELDAERARLEAERQALKAPRTEAASGQIGAAPPRTRKPGRPPLHTKIETAVVVTADSTDKAAEQGRLRGGAMSLATPKKRKMDDFMDGYSSDESPSEQLLFDYGRAQSRTNGGLQPPKYEPEDMSPHLDAVPRAPVAPRAPMEPKTAAPIKIDDGRYLSVKSQYSKKPRLATKLVLPLMSSSATTRPSNPERSASFGMPLPTQKGNRGMVKASAQANMHAARPITDYLSTVFGGNSSSASSVRNATPPQPVVSRAASSGPSKRHEQIKQVIAQPAKTNCNPPPPMARETQPATQRAASNGPPRMKAKTTQIPARPINKNSNFPPHVAIKKEPLSSQPLIQKEADSGMPRPQTNTKPAKAASNPPPQLPRDKDLLRPPAQRAANSVPPNTQPRDRSKPIFRSHVARKKTPSKQSSSHSSKPKPPPIVAFSDSDSDDEALWIVERLEAMELYDVEGQGLKRYFQVRWAGDWPPDQNPTWEPEENIPDEMVAEFCRAFQASGAVAKRRRKSRTESVEEEEENALPPPRKPARTGMVMGEDGEEEARPSSAKSGLFVYSSDDAMEKHVWDAPNSQGQRPNLNLVYPAQMM